LAKQGLRFTAEQSGGRSPIQGAHGSHEEATGGVDGTARRSGR
jgi:hypothetical protein